MCKYVKAAIPVLALAVLTLACNGGGGTATPGGTPGGTPGETPTGGPTEALTPQPSPTEIEGTAAAGQTPTTEPTATTAATPGASPIAMGTPAVAPADLSAYEGMAIDQEECLFDPRTALADCLARGLYTIEPPLGGEDISCSVLIVQDEPVLLLCRSQDPQRAVYYAIQGAP